MKGLNMLIFKDRIRGTMYCAPTEVYESKIRFIS